MRILVCGSSGCVGSAVVAALRWRGHRVVETRHRAASAAKPPTVALDFMQAVPPERWAALLATLQIDAIVNCVGVLIPSRDASFERIHVEGPVELFRGAVAAGVARIVQVSALGVGVGVGDGDGDGDGDAPRSREEPAYLSSKRRAEDAVLALPGIDAAVVRPSLVYGPASQSARLFATLAALPVIALPGRGRQRVAPVQVLELAEAIASLVDRSGGTRGIYELGGPAVSYREMLASYRTAHGLGEAVWLAMPMPLMRLGAMVAEHLPQRAFCRDTLRLLERGNVPSRNALPVLLGRRPAGLAEALAVAPVAPAFDLRVQLAWPVTWALRLSLAFLWLQTAIVSAFLPHESGVLDLLARCGFAGRASWAALALSCALNVALGITTLLRPTVLLYAVQCAAVAGYTLTAAVNAPSLTIDHCGPLAKNIPLLVAIVVLWLGHAGQPRGATSPVPRDRPTTPARRGAPT